MRNVIVKFTASEIADNKKSLAVYLGHNLDYQFGKQFKFDFEAAILIMALCLNFSKI